MCNFFFFWLFPFWIGKQLVRIELGITLTSALTHAITYKCKPSIIMMIHNIIMDIDGRMLITSAL